MPLTGELHCISAAIVEVDQGEGGLLLSLAWLGDPAEGGSNWKPG